jgi:hypothetical protein
MDLEKAKKVNLDLSFIKTLVSNHIQTAAQTLIPKIQECGSADLSSHLENLTNQVKTLKQGQSV